MAGTAIHDVPAESDLLCESCGYTLNGLDESSRCPECGRAIAESSPKRRYPSRWDTATGLGVALLALITTTVAVLFRPAHFYRHLATRPTIDRSSLFARLHWLLAAILIGFGVFVHTRITDGSETMGIIGAGPVVPAMITYVLLELITLAAARLTAWEAAYRGLRLPPRAVRRGLHFHAAHYLPVGLLFLGTVVGYESTRFGGMEVTTYLYILCAQVIVVAAYLFNTYWIGMRNMMYANR